MISFRILFGDVMESPDNVEKTSSEPETLTNEELRGMLVNANPKDQLPSLAKKIIKDCDLSNLAFDFPIDFSHVKFSGTAKFENVGFRAGATFIGTNFEGDANFSLCRFVDYGYFWNSTFRGKAIFLRAVFEAGKPGADHPRHPGEANFSYSQFVQDVDFQRARFGGISYFHCTKFGRYADFAEARFDREVRFDGSRNDICVPKCCLPESAQTYLEQQRLTCQCPDNPAYINFDKGIQCAKDLEDRLTYPGETRRPLPNRFSRRKRQNVTPSRKSQSLTPTEIGEVVRLYEQHHKLHMFSPKHEANFRSVKVAGGPTSDERAFFSSANLSLCRFQDCTISKFAFYEVDWASRRTTFHLSSRYAIRDEDKNPEGPASFENDPSRVPGDEKRELRTPEKYRAIGRLYRELRRKAESEGEIERAKDFYYGELEMAYKSRRWPLRCFSLLFLYRYFSGYGKQHGLAAAWLFLFIFVIFPASYYTLAKEIKEFGGDRLARAVYAEERSLHASTLLTPSQDFDLGLAGDFLTSLERIVVPLQTGLLLLAIKYNFQHKLGD